MTDAKPYDAHASADQNENTFTLQGRDPYTPGLINLWAILMSGDLPMLESAYDKIRSALNSEINLGNTFGNVQMTRGKHTQAYHFAMMIREGQDSPKISNEYDAHSTAEKGEQTFTLQSNDPYFADLIELWAALMTGNKNETEMRFREISKTFQQQSQTSHAFGKKQRKRGKIVMAFQLSKEIQNSLLSTV